MTPCSSSANRAHPPLQGVKRHAVDSNHDYKSIHCRWYTRIMIPESSPPPSQAEYWKALKYRLQRRDVRDGTGACRPRRFLPWNASAGYLDIADLPYLPYRSTVHSGPEDQHDIVMVKDVSWRSSQVYSYIGHGNCFFMILWPGACALLPLSHVAVRNQDMTDDKLPGPATRRLAEAAANPDSGMCVVDLDSRGRLGCSAKAARVEAWVSKWKPS